MTATTESASALLDGPADVGACAGQFAAMSDEQLDAAWDRFAGWSVRVVAYGAALLSEMRRRGRDLSELKRRLGRHFDRLQLVASGKVLPETLYRFGPSPLLFHKVATLPPEEQKRLADNPPLEVAVREDGNVTHRLIRPLDMPAPLVHQVFGPDGQRTVEQQIAWIEGRPNVLPRPARRKDVRIDAKAGGVWIKGDFYSRAELRRFVEELDQK